MNATIKVKKHRVESRERPETPEKNDYSNVTIRIVMYQYIDKTILPGEFIPEDERFPPGIFDPSKNAFLEYISGMQKCGCRTYPVAD